MALIKDEEINAIREQSDIVDIISQYLTLTKQGKNYVAVCPFHDDHSPSLVVSPEKQIFNCFTCRTGGNVFSFIMKYENVGFLEAVKMVADKVGYKINLDFVSANEKVNQVDYEIMDLAKKYYLNNIFTEIGVSARKYLNSRKLEEDIIREFNLGLAPSSKNDLYKILIKKGYTVEKIEELGLINRVGLEVYDAFTNRIMIPIENLKGDVVGFSARIFNGETDAAKYINTRETPIFKKGQILFNFHNARKYIRNEKLCIIVEGNMDAINVSASGIKNVVALMGVALSLEQIKVIKRLNVPVVLMLDNDEAGLNATMKNGKLLQENGVIVKVVKLTGAKDPDEYIRAKGVDALKENIKYARNFIDFKLEFLKTNKNLENIDDLVNYVKEVINSLNDENDLTKQVVISKISKDYNIDYALLQNQINLMNVNHEIESSKKVKVKKYSKYELASAKVLYYMMNDAKYITIYKNKLGYLKERVERRLISEIIFYNNEHNSINLANFLTYIMEQQDLFEYVNQIISMNDENLNDDEFNNCIEIILKILKLDEINQLKEEIKKEMDVNKKVELISKLTELKKEV